MIGTLLGGLRLAELSEVPLLGLAQGGRSVKSNGDESVADRSPVG